MQATQSKTQVQHATEATFQSMVLNSNTPVLVDFYADWCGPCQRLAPVLEELAAELSTAKVVKVNVDQNPNLAQTYGVEAIPNLKVFKDGQIVEETAGLVSKGQLRAMLDR